MTADCLPPNPRNFPATAELGEAPAVAGSHRRRINDGLTKGQRFYRRHREQVLADQRARYARTRAVRPGCPTWSTMFADDVDEVTVERIMAGERPERYTSFERREAVRRLDAQRMPRQQIAVLVGVHGRQVYRDLAWLASQSSPVVHLPAGATG